MTANLQSNNAWKMKHYYLITMSMNVLCKVKVAMEAEVEEPAGLLTLASEAAVVPAGFVGSFFCEGWSMLVSFSGGVASLSESSLTSELNKALVLLANTPKSISVEVNVSNTSQTRTVQTVSRREIRWSAWKKGDTVTQNYLHISTDLTWVPFSRKNSLFLRKEELNCGCFFLCGDVFTLHANRIPGMLFMAITHATYFCAK